MIYNDIYFPYYMYYTITEDKAIVQCYILFTGYRNAFMY